MKRIIRLTESDLTRIVKRVISEQGEDKTRCLYQEKTFIEETIGGPMNRRQVFEKEHGKKLYQIDKSAPHTLRILDYTPNASPFEKKCFNWECDNSILGIRYWNCKAHTSTFN